MLIYIAFAISSAFDAKACGKLKPYLQEHIKGQDEVISQFSSAICHHARMPNPRRPAIIVTHGPTGTGKSMTYDLALDVLYGVHCFEAPTLDLETLPEFQSIWNSIKNKAKEIQGLIKQKIPMRKRIDMCREKVQPSGGGPFYVCLNFLNCKHSIFQTLNMEGIKILANTILYMFIFMQKLKYATATGMSKEVLQETLKLQVMKFRHSCEYIEIFN